MNLSPPASPTLSLPRRAEAEAEAKAEHIRFPLSASEFQRTVNMLLILVGGCLLVEEFSLLSIDYRANGTSMPVLPLADAATEEAKSDLIGEVLYASDDRFDRFDFMLTVPAGLLSSLLGASQVLSTWRDLFSRDTFAGRIRSAGFMLASMVLGSLEALLGLELAASLLVRGIFDHRVSETTRLWHLWFIAGLLLAATVLQLMSVLSHVHAQDQGLPLLVVTIKRVVPQQQQQPGSNANAALKTSKTLRYGSTDTDIDNSNKNIGDSTTTTSRATLRIFGGGGGGGNPPSSPLKSCAAGCISQVRAAAACLYSALSSANVLPRELLRGLASAPSSSSSSSSLNSSPNSNNNSSSKNSSSKAAAGWAGFSWAGQLRKEEQEERQLEIREEEKEERRRRREEKREIAAATRVARVAKKRREAIIEEAGHRRAARSKVQEILARNQYESDHGAPHSHDHRAQWQNQYFAAGQGEYHFVGTGYHHSPRSSQVMQGTAGGLAAGGGGEVRKSPRDQVGNSNSRSSRTRRGRIVLN